MDQVSRSACRLHRLQHVLRGACSVLERDRDLAYRHDHVPAEKAYFDFAGLTLRHRDGERILAVHIYTAALGWSNAINAYAYAEGVGGVG